MTQPTGNPQHFLLMPASQSQAQPDSLQNTQFGMNTGQPQGQQVPLTIIPMGSQPYQQYQYVSGAQLQQFPATYVIQQPGPSCAGGDRPQYLVPQPVQVIQHPQYIFTPGQQLSTNQQSVLMPAGGQQLLAVNGPAPYLSNQFQFVPSNTITYRQKPLSPTVGDLPGGMIWKVPPSSLSPDSGTVSPRFETSTQKSNQEGNDESRDESSIHQPDKDNTEDEEEMVPISLKNKYENIKYNPDLELQYLSETTKYTGLTNRDNQTSKRRNQLHEYLRDRPLKKIAPPTPMFAVYQLREQNWRRKLSKRDKIEDVEEDDGEVQERGEGRDSVLTERGFRTLSEMLGTMHDDTFTHLDKEEFKNCHYQAWHKDTPKMISMTATDSEDDDYEDDVFEAPPSDEQSLRTRLQSFGFDTPDRHVVKAPQKSPTQESQTSGASSEFLKDSAFSDDSHDELSNDSDSRHGNETEKVLTENAKNAGKQTSRDFSLKKRSDTVTIVTAKQTEDKTSKDENSCPASESSELEKLSRQTTAVPTTISSIDASKIKFQKGTAQGQKKKLDSPNVPCVLKRKKVSPKYNLRKPEGRRPLRKPRQPRRTRESLPLTTDWLARAAFLATSGFRERTSVHHKQKSRNV
ncbi:uncharacterized protein [Ptychodera flava]|uniref:uncharacterized protein n=1 Tax=Ptychodera flava TaxID=63121 RepID=UPI00396A7E5A